VARQFYLEGVSKVDIADRLGISRFRVARLLDSARDAGMVRIEIGLPGGTLDPGLSAELCSAFGLRHAFVFNFPDNDEQALRHRLGEATGQALMDLITPGDVLGMSWSRTLSGLAASLTQIPPCPIVQLTGAVPPPDGRDLLDLVRSVARVGGGPAHVFYALMILDDAQTAEAIRRQGDIAGAFALLPSVTIAVVAIGAWTPGLSTIYDAVTPDEREALAALGVCAGVFVGADGRPVLTPLDGRMIVTPGPVLERIPFVLSVAYGVAKSPAVCAAIRGRLVHGLVTHASPAREMLSASPRGGLQPPRADWRYCESGAGHPGGDTVLRPAAPCWRATHALLGHLAEVGFDGAPRVLAAGPVTETLTYIDGHAAVPPLPENTLTDSALVSVADLVRRYHLAAASFDPSGYQWPRPIPVRFRTGLVSHNDVHPAKLVFRDGRAVALIDFDLAGPGSAIWDFAAAARYWAPLQDEQDITDSRQGRALERFRVFLHASGLRRADRRHVAEAVVANHDWTYAIVTEAAAAGHRGFADHWRMVAEHATRARRWCQRHQRDLIAAAR
jgi:DNA-binding transcriptional regulator LsrR (DeoR family)